MREKLNKTHLKCSRSPACCLVWSERVWVSVHEITGMSVMLLNDPVLFHLIPRESLYQYVFVSAARLFKSKYTTFIYLASRAEGYRVSKSSS